MTRHNFKRIEEDSLITIPCRIGNDRYTFALDTGASHTVVDLTPLLMSGYQMKDVLRIVELETGKGIIEAYVFKLKIFSTLGITRQNIEVCSYDFLANQVLSEFDGVLGLDFFQNEKICIDFAESEITVTKR
jgi:predicted aspartyl protease